MVKSKKGFNTVGTDYKYIGTATVAEALVDGNGTIRNADSYLVSDGDDTTSRCIDNTKQCRFSTVGT